MKQAFEFGTYTDITEYAKAKDSQYNDFEKVYICSDTWDYWIARICKDTYDDERKGYETAEGWYLVERNKIGKESKGESIKSRRDLNRILEEDDLSNWDTLNNRSLEAAIEAIDGGFGINECPYQPTKTTQP